MTPRSLPRSSFVALFVVAASCGSVRSAAAQSRANPKIASVEARAIEAIDRGDYVAAIDLLLNATKATTSAPFLLKELASALAKNHQMAESVAVYRQYLARVPNDDDVLLSIASVHIDGQSEVEAETALGEFLEKHPTDSRALLARASVRVRLGRIPDAIVDCRAYVEQVPDDEVVLFELARQLATGDHPAGREEAVKRLTIYLTSHSSDRALLELAEILTWGKEKHDLEGALKIYNGYLLAHRNDLTFVLKRAHVLSWLKMDKLAAADFRACLQRDPNGPCLLAFADVLRWTSEAGEAVSLYDRYLLLHPEDIEARIRRAEALSKKGENEAAIAALTMTRSLAKTNAQFAVIDLALAKIFSDTGRPFQAADVLDASLQRDPTNDKARTARDALGPLVGSNLRARAFFSGDVSGNQLFSMGVQGHAMIGTHFALLSELEAWSVGSPDARVGTGLVNVGAWGRYKALTFEAVAGPRIYENASTKAGVRASTHLSAASWVNLELAYRYDDLYLDLLQPSTLAADVRGHTLYLANFAQVGPVSIFARAGGRLVTPDNQMLDAMASVQVRVVGPIYVGYTGTFLSWQKSDPSYWSPQFFLDHDGLVRWMQPIGSSFTVDLQAWAGANADRTAGFDGDYVLDYGGSGALSLKLGRADIAANVFYIHTKRDDYVYYLVQSTASFTLHL